ncbi:MAG: L,D-transpeptidase [Bacteriovorax sp.]|jgi:murein L,D-transpeptidase YafK|nr:L,D-transpeptidase [Bacteriovorax sp.]
MGQQHLKLIVTCLAFFFIALETRAEAYKIASPTRRYCRFEETMSNYPEVNDKKIKSPIDYIMVSKKNQKMFLVANDKVVRIFPVVFGLNAYGHKQFSGDFKTPEGLYFIEDKNPGSKFHKSLHISYPNINDDRFARSQGYSAGGDIMLHGLPDKKINETTSDMAKRVAIEQAQFFGINWTRGCIAMENEVIDEVYALISRQTLIEICPQ